ncbi:MAG: winged helix DNA-binding protein [Candidatus Bathyarchaeota archaeon]|nr:MAG: winged helix DNA-binding protein [Candidatus Bathyarchaeota archaeon]
MSGYPSVTPSSKVPEEFLFLCMLHNIGAINTERAITIEEIAKWTERETGEIQYNLTKLEELGYVAAIHESTVDRFHVSPSGIRKVLTLYS